MCAPKLGLLLLFINMPITIAFLQPDVDVVLTVGAYKEMFERRRIDHLEKVKKLHEMDCVKNYKMLSMAIEKIFQLIKRDREILIDNKYSVSQGFPNSNPLQTAVRELLESTCLLAELGRNFPDITYPILKTIPDWKHTVNWCISFVQNFPYITEVMVDALMKTFSAAVNFDERNPHNPKPNFLKPLTTTTPKPKTKKPRKKLKKGPPSMWKDEL